MKTLLLLAIAAIVAAFALAAPASASASGKKTTCRSTVNRFAITVTGTRDECRYDGMIADDLPATFPTAMFTRGTRSYTVPRHGTNYVPGEDWRCRVTVRTKWYAAEEHPVARMTAVCTFMGRASTRFVIRSGWYA